jgi:peptidoglycan L-alanyl-D-glutamate endopeptidase CwlK
VHPDLVRVVEAAAENGAVPFMVIEGLRTVDRQKYLVSIGRSQTMTSRHLTGHAVDLGVLTRAGAVDWTKAAYERLSTIVLAEASRLAIAVEWGGSWKSFFDGPHFQLSRATYP